jgi:hypothetical protein
MYVMDVHLGKTFNPAKAVLAALNPAKDSTDCI